MANMGTGNRHIEDIGRILLQVQSEIKNLREQTSADTNDGKAAIHKLQGTLERAEKDLRTKAEVVLQAITNENATVLPTVPVPDHSEKSQGVGRLPRAKHIVPTPPARRPLASESIRLQKNANLLNNPQAMASREFFEKEYGVSQGEVHKKRARVVGKKPLGKTVHGKTAHPQALLPKANRIDTTAPPPTLGEDELEKGMLNLMNRGFVPPHVDLTPAFMRMPAPLAQAPVTLRPFGDQFAKVNYVPPLGFNMSNVKLDLLTKVEGARKEEMKPAPPAEVVKAPIQQTQVEFAPEETQPAQPGEGQPPEGEMMSPPMKQEARGYNELLDAYSLHQFIIRRGRTLDTTPEFQSFKRKHAMHWGRISELIQYLERILLHYAVPLAYVDGAALARLAVDEMQTPTVDHLLQCIVNLDQVGSLIKIPGRRYKGPDGEQRAATAIQSTWRMFVRRRLFVWNRQRVWAAVSIQRMWKGFWARKQMQARLEEARNADEQEWRAMMEQFYTDWPRIQSDQHIIIHLPSITREEHTRYTTPNFPIRQNCQLGRLCSVADPNCTVIYIAPFPLGDELQLYYNKLLDIGGVMNPEERYQVLFPENYGRFPEHFSLTTMLLYSPRCLKKIKYILKQAGVPAYIVPGVIGPEEVKLSLELKVPLLSPEPRVANLYSTKSGSKRIFAAAQVNMAPGVHDIYEMGELLTHLARLIVDNMDIPRWLLKIDDEWGGRGHAYLDVSTLKTYAEIKEEQEKMPSIWANPATAEQAKERVLKELDKVIGKRVAVVNTRVYPDWDTFIDAFCRVGGVVEGCPAIVTGSPSVNLLIEPDGHIRLMSTHEQIFGQPFCFSGAVFPQFSVPFPAIRDCAIAIGKACYEKNIVGYVGVDFVTVWDQEYAQKLWAVDLNLRLTDTESSSMFFQFIVGGHMDMKTGQYLVTTEGQKGPPSQRYYVVNNYLYHNNLGNLHYTSFFNLCRMNGVSFDLQEKIGTAFQLVDSFAGGVMGVLSVGKSMQDALKTMQDSIRFVQMQVGNQVIGREEFAPDVNNFRDFSGAVKSLMDKLSQSSKAKK